MKKAVVLCGVAFLVASFVGSAQRAEARPQYLKTFTEKYEKVAEKAKEAKCMVCHPDADPMMKKIRNDYGKAIGTSLGKNAEGEDVKNEKDVAKITAAMEKAGKEKNAAGKTFGEVIESGELPNK